MSINSNLIISEAIQAKLAVKHNVTPAEVAECFANICGRFLLDPRAEHKSDPPTQWFISETNMGRKLKVVFILDGEKIYLRSAFPPNDVEMRIYNKYGM